MRVLVASTILFALLTTMDAENPYEFASTPGKLPKQVVPLEYSIRIVPDLAKLTFAGSERIKVKATAPIRELVLNSAELEIAKASVDGIQLSPDEIKLDPNNELLTLVLPNELPAGEHAIALEFSGKITPKGRGLYYMPYQEQGTGAKKVALGTQFEPSDARRFFPCWDEPSFRARFQLTAAVPGNWLAVSNMPIESERKIDPPSPNASPARTSGATSIGKEVRFQATPSISSYLNVFVGGELELIETKAAGTQIRVIATKGKAESGRYALESTTQILEYFNDYFGAPYPLPKLDQIAIPGGFGGAMENWGGITYCKGQAFLLMLESFLGEDAFRDGIRRYIAAHKNSNSTTADLWNALSDASGKPVGEIAAAWTEQPGFPVIKVKRNGESVSLTQERFTIHFPKAPPLQWKIPLTYFLVGENKPQTRLMAGKIDNLQNIPVNRALKLNAEGAGNY